MKTNDQELTLKVVNLFIFDKNIDLSVNNNYNLIN